jgi:hypothetical protein
MRFDTNIKKIDTNVKNSNRRLSMRHFEFNIKESSQYTADIKHKTCIGENQKHLIITSQNLSIYYEIQNDNNPPPPVAKPNQVAVFGSTVAVLLSVLKFRRPLLIHQSCR